jgi:hypothetical protein
MKEKCITGIGNTDFHRDEQQVVIFGRENN